VVRDIVTDDPIVGVQVSVPGEDPVITDEGGGFRFTDISAGEMTVTATKDGYYEEVQEVLVQGRSGTDVTLLMIPELDHYGIAVVRSRYSGHDRHVYYLDDVSMNETFTAAIDWKEYTPDKIRWETSGGTYEDPCPGMKVERTFDMGTDFGPEGWMRVVGVSLEGEETVPYEANFKVISTPDGINAGRLYNKPFGNTLMYTAGSISLQSIKMVDAGKEGGEIPDDMPLVGGKAFKVVAFLDISADVGGDGNGHGTVKLPLPGGGSKKMKIAGISFQPSVSGSVLWKYYDALEGWVIGGGAEAGINVSVSEPPVPIYIIIPPCPIPVYFRGRIDMGFYRGLELMSWAAPGEPIWNGTLSLNPLLYGEFMVGAGAADILAVEGYGGIGAKVIVDREGGASSGVADFRLATGAGGQIALVWQEVSDDLEAIADMWAAIYDATVQQWSKPQRLTEDKRMEYAMAPAFDGAGDLVAAYDKSHVEYETRTVTIGEEEFEVEVPLPGQVDLYFLRHEISGDLAVEDGDISITPPNPIATEMAMITAEVGNYGDFGVTDLVVAFYDGDPGNEGILIAADTLADTLVGGDKAGASVIWEVPESTEPHDIYVVVDPNLVQEDRDRTNNTAVLNEVMKPDAYIESILVQEAGNLNCILTVRLANIGALAFDTLDVTLHRDRLDGPDLATLSVLSATDSIPPRAFQDLTWTWQLTPLEATQDITVYAVCDEAGKVDEYDETNNIRSVRIPARHPERALSAR
jgi:hypothetical protein